MSSLQSYFDFGLDLADESPFSAQPSAGCARTVSRCTVSSNLPDERRWAAAIAQVNCVAAMVHCGLTVTSDREFLLALMQAL